MEENYKPNRTLTEDEKLILNCEVLDFAKNYNSVTAREIGIFKTGYKLGLYSKDFIPIDKLTPELIEKYVKSDTQLLIQIKETTKFYRAGNYTCHIKFIDTLPYFTIDNIDRDETDGKFIVPFRSTNSWKEI